jgi:peptide/nickel transport system substrate-binding protein
MQDSARTPSRPGRVPRRAARSLRTVTVGVLAVAVAVVSAACSTADAANEPDQAKQGGTLRVVLGDAMSHLDPQQLYTATEANFSRLITRTLTTFRSEPGPASSQIVGDLATDTGRPSDNNKVWEFTLKQGVRWEDGNPITCQDVKYGVERSFSKLFTDGAKYPAQYLADNAEKYEGPFTGNNNNGQGLRSIECVDARTIRFRLKQPVGDFGYTVAMSVFAPVPTGKDTKDQYDKRPFANGPYKIEENSKNQLVYVRNNFWDRSTDGVRKALPDRIVVTWSADTPSVTNNLIQSEGEWADSVAVEKDVASNFVQQVVNDPELTKRTISGSTGAVRYFAVNARTVTDVRCRQALSYAFNKRKYRAALGGAVFGDYATSMIPPQLKAHKEFDLYNTQGNPEGDPEKARELMKQAADAGKACPTRIKLAYPDTKDITRLITTIVESYQRIGVQVERKPFPQKGYFDTAIGNPAHGNDLMYAGWVPDWANGSAVIPPLFSSRVIPKNGGTGNTNFSNLTGFDPQIDEALAEPRLDRQYKMWGDLDEKIQQQAATIPVLYGKALRMTGNNVRGGFIHPQFGQPDLCAIGLARGK